ncbi:MAG TPA: YgiT-type zinc finger protein [Candidatus Binatia bacterium]
MKCTVCGARMHPITTDLPFKLSEERIIILKQLPVLQCEACREYLIEDSVMVRIDILLTRGDSAAELEVIRYAA